MKNKFLIIAIITVIGFTMIVCNKSGKSTGGGENSESNESVETDKTSESSISGSNGVKIINSGDELKAYLDKQPANGPDKPIKVTVSINNLTLNSIIDAIKSAGKYVNLNIAGNVLTAIPKNAFSHCEPLVGITIPNSVTSIGDLAFSNCANLNSVKIPDGVTHIGYGAFEKCAELTSITIGNGVTSIGMSAFYECAGLTSVIIGKSVTNIGMSAFFGCKNLTSVSFEKADTGLDNLNEFIDNENTSSLRAAYSAGGIGTYTRPNTKNAKWTKQ